MIEHTNCSLNLKLLESLVSCEIYSINYKKEYINDIPYEFGEHILAGNDDYWSLREHISIQDFYDYAK